MTPIIIEDATVEPLTFEDIVEHSALPYDQHQQLVESYIRSARMSCENDTDSTISPKTLEIAFERFPCVGYRGDYYQSDLGGYYQPDYRSQWMSVYRNRSQTIELPLGPVSAVLSIKYIDPDGTELTLDPSTYALDGYRRTAVIRLAYGASWPSTRSQFDGTKVRYRAGYAIDNSPPALVPEPILHAMRLLVDHMIENRSAVDVNTLMELPLGVKHKLDPYRREMGV